MAWTSEGTGIGAQIDQGRSAAAAAAAGTAREARATGLTAAQGDGVDGAVVHDSVGMSQARVHAEDSSVSVAPRQEDLNSGGEASSTALTVAGGGHSVALPEGVYDANGQQLDTRRENRCDFSIDSDHFWPISD